ncbi:MAG: BatD family protein, partial [Simkania sp.]|nr:BatD family protein [Simkania sp.]
ILFEMLLQTSEESESLDSFLLDIPWLFDFPVGLALIDLEATLEDFILRNGGGFLIKQLAKQKDPFQQKMHFHFPHEKVNLWSDFSQKEESFLRYSFHLKFEAKAKGTYVFAPVSLKGELLEKSFFCRSEPLSLEVSDPPKENQPKGYTNALGSFSSVEINLFPKHYTGNFGEPFAVEFNVEGEGNLVSLLAPDFPEISEQFEVRFLESLWRPGQKSFYYLFSPKSEKIKEIPPCPFHYCSIDTREYLTIWTPPLWLKGWKRLSREAAEKSTENSEEKNFKREGDVPAVMLVMDYSMSMRSLDFDAKELEDTRFFCVQQAIQKMLLLEKELGLYGIIGFGQMAKLYCPLTSDRLYLLEQLELMNDSANEDQQGSVLGEALLLAIERLQGYPGKTKSIVVFTDGGEDLGRVRPLPLTDLALKFNIQINVVALNNSRGLGIFKRINPFG